MNTTVDEPVFKKDKNVKEYKGFSLDPFQQEALERLHEGDSILVSAPTGAGKTLIAEYAMEHCLEAGKEIIYTAPIKALSNQKFRQFSEQFGDDVGIMTGDVTINPEATAIIMTTEVFRNTIFEDPSRLENVRYCIFDEVHYMDDEMRGTVWEESIIFAPQHIRFICLSATIKNLPGLSDWMNEIRDYDTSVIKHFDRPVPLKKRFYVPKKGFADINRLKKLYHSRSRKNQRSLSRSQRNKWENKLLDHLDENNQYPALFFVFSRKGCQKKAARHTDRQLLSQSESDRARALFDQYAEKLDLHQSRNCDQLRELTSRGIAYHHAGLLPSLKDVVERMFTEGLIKLMIATETFALGINMPARSVIFESLEKYDGTEMRYMKSREFNQMAGRAGRRGMDEVGYVYSMVNWPDFHYPAIKRLKDGDIEPIQSKFGLDYTTLINLYHRLKDQIYEAMQKSFLHFQTQHKSQDKTPRDYREITNQVEKKLQLLREFDYLDGKQITEKGWFASRVNGYEIQAAEFVYSGLLEEVSEMQLILLMTATIFEERGREQYADFSDRKFLDLIQDAKSMIRDVNEREKELGIHDKTRMPSEAICGSVYQWSVGTPFKYLHRYTSVAEGDLVRVLRMSIQLMRQMYRSLPSDVMLKRKLMKCVEIVNRGVVDARKQLETDL